MLSKRSIEEQEEAGRIRGRAQALSGKAPFYSKAFSRYDHRPYQRGYVEGYKEVLAMKQNCPVPCNCTPEWTLATGIDWFWKHGPKCPHTGRGFECKCPSPDGTPPAEIIRSKPDKIITLLRTQYDELMVADKILRLAIQRWSLVLDEGEGYLRLLEEPPTSMRVPVSPEDIEILKRIVPSEMVWQ